MMFDWPSTDLLHQRATTTPSQTALHFPSEDTTYSWESLDRRVGHLAAALTDDIDTGDRIGIVLNSSQAFLEVNWAVTRLGACVVPLHVDRPSTTLCDRLQRTDPRGLIGSASTLDEELTTLDCAVWSTTPLERSGVRYLEPATEVVKPVTRAPTDEHLIMFTSGTTDFPKGVRLTDANLLASAIASALRLGTDPADRWLDCLPMAHMGGFAPIIRSAVNGTTLVVGQEFDTAVVPSIIDEASVTGISLVPTMLRRFLDADWQPPESLDTVLLGGAPAGQALIEDALEAGVPLYPTYGLTEAASQVATATPSTISTKPDTVGHPLFLTEVTIVDDDQICGPGEIGELIIDGPTVTPGYLDPTTTSSATTSYGLATGDLGYKDEQGRLYIQGRVDEHILTGGETVAPATVETALTDHPAIREAAVVGLPDPEWGEQVAALVVIESTLSVTTEEIHEHCATTLAPFERPKTISLTDHLPRTASGTIDRDEVRTMLAGHAGDGQV